MLWITYADMRYRFAPLVLKSDKQGKKMARSEDVLAKRLVEAEDVAYSPSFYHRAAGPRAFLLRDTENEYPRVKELPPFQERRARSGSENLLRTYILADFAALVLGFLCAGLLVMAVNAIFLD